MDLLSQSEMSAMPDLGHRLRQLRWFRRSFRSSAAALCERYGLKMEIDDEMLATVFINWVETLDEKKALASVNRADFILFSGGLALKELIKTRPATAAFKSATNIETVPEIVAFWPEGFLYVNYCISAVSAVYQQELGRPLELSESVDDIRTWWSFKENTAEVPAYAIAFLDRFFGVEPNWMFPDMPEVRSGMGSDEDTTPLAGAG